MDQTQAKDKETAIKSAMSVKETLNQKMLTRICEATENDDFCLKALLNKTTNF